VHADLGLPVGEWVVAWGSVLHFVCVHAYAVASAAAAAVDAAAVNHVATAATSDAACYSPLPQPLPPPTAVLATACTMCEGAP
jgi:hypothetical protein